MNLIWSHSKVFLSEIEHAIPIHFHIFMNKLPDIENIDFWYGGRWIPVKNISSFFGTIRPHIMFNFQYVRSVAVPVSCMHVHRINRYLIRVSLKNKHSHVWEII